jgi:hypothetical protein
VVSLIYVYHTWYKFIKHLSTTLHPRYARVTNDRNREMEGVCIFLCVLDISTLPHKASQNYMATFVKLSVFISHNINMPMFFKASTLGRRHLGDKAPWQRPEICPL